jgi:cilia- and flagella-associated protein 251
MQVHNDSVVVGCGDGAVRFYDYLFRAIAWFEDLSAGAIKSITFEKTNNDQSKKILRDKMPKDNAQDEYDDADDDGHHLRHHQVDITTSGHFLVSTASALVVRVNPACFNELLADKRRGKLLLQA